MRGVPLGGFETVSATAPPKTATRGGDDGYCPLSAASVDDAPPELGPDCVRWLGGGRFATAASCTAISAPTFALCRTLREPHGSEVKTDAEKTNHRSNHKLQTSRLYISLCVPITQPSVADLPITPSNQGSRTTDEGSKLPPPSTWYRVRYWPCRDVVLASVTVVLTHSHQGDVALERLPCRSLVDAGKHERGHVATLQAPRFGLV